MRLAFVLLKNVQNSNCFQEVEEYVLQTGNPDTIYFRLINLDQRDPVTGRYLRFIPDTAATGQLTLGSIDQSKVIQRAATTPFTADDRSIWQVPILATDFVSANGASFQLNNLGNTYTVSLRGNLTSTPCGPTGQGGWYA